MDDSFPEIVTLPELLYKIGEEPSNPSMKINKFYNKKNIVKHLEQVVGHVVFNRLKASVVGPIIKTVERNLEMSGKLLQYILMRNILTKKKDELWFHFGGQPMRFSIREFHMVTGLKCSGDLNVASYVKGEIKWHDLETRKHTLDQLLHRIGSLETDAVEDKFKLGMLFVIESLFMTTYTGCYYDIDSVKVAKDVNNMNNYPWGRKAFKILLESVKVILESPVKKETYNISGFPMALHLWVLQSVPNLQSAFSVIDKKCNGFICERFIEVDAPSLQPICNIEKDNVEVTMILPSLENDIEDSVNLDDEVDIILEGMMDLVRNGYRIQMEDWQRGFVDYVQAMDAIATQKYKTDYHQKVQEEEINENKNVTLDMIYSFMEQQFASLTERMGKIEEQMKIYNDNVADRNGRQSNSVFSFAEKNQDQDKRENVEKEKDNETEQNERKSFQDDVNNCFDDAEIEIPSSFNNTQETVKLNLNSMDYIGSDNSKLSKTVEVDFDNDSVNPNTTPEDIAELKNNEIGESSKEQSHHSEQLEKQDNDCEQTPESSINNVLLRTEHPSPIKGVAEKLDNQEDNDGVQTTKITDIVVWKTPETSSNNVVLRTEDHLPSFSLNISPVQTQDTEKLKRHLTYEDDDSKRRKISVSESSSSKGVAEKLDNQEDIQVSVAVNNILLKLRRSERVFKPIDYNITPFRAPPNPANSMKPVKHSLYHPFLAPNVEKMNLWNQWMHERNPSIFNVGRNNLGPQWFKYIIDPHKTLYEEHVDAIFQMLRVRRESDPAYFHNNRLPKAAFLQSSFLKKMKNDHYNAEFLKLPAFYEWPDDMVEDAISEKWMDEVDVLYGFVRRLNNCFGMSINLKLHTLTVYSGKYDEVHSPFVHLKPFAELFSSLLFVTGIDKKMVPFVIKTINRNHCPNRKLATNNGFSIVKQIECHYMGIEDVSELSDTNEVDLRNKMASDLYYHFQYE